MVDNEDCNYTLIKKIASGAFGDIYLAVYKSSRSKIAIKIEKQSNFKQLKHEYNVYRSIFQENNNFIPKVYEYRQFTINAELFNGMVMELLGPSLQELFDSCSKKFSLKTVLMLGEMLISRIEYIHRKNHLHRDIKPDNFVFGLDRNNLYIIDFGLSKLYRNPTTFDHVPPKTGKSLTGTARYASLNAHIGHEQGRRDDLESLGYCLIFFLKGKLPWQGLQGVNKQEKYRNIRKMKEQTTVRELCEGLPPLFSKYLYYVKGLSFAEMPSYLYLKNLFVSAMREFKIRNDGVFDWMVRTVLEQEGHLNI